MIILYAQLIWGITTNGVDIDPYIKVFHLQLKRCHVHWIIAVVGIQNSVAAVSSHVTSASSVC